MPERRGSRRRSATCTSVLVVLYGNGSDGHALLVEHDELASICALDRCPREHLGRWPEGDLAAIEAKHEVEVACAVHVVRGHEHGPALVPELGQQGGDALRAPRV